MRVQNLLVKLLFSIFLRKKRVFVVFGLRRSGNHAFVNWFINALEGNDVSKLNELIKWHVFNSSSYKTIFFNEVNKFKMRNLIYFLFSERKILNSSKNIILSFEDINGKYIEDILPTHFEKITIKRSLLNVIASRLQRSIKEAKAGLARTDMNVDEGFIKTFIFICNAKSDGYSIWDYELWLKEKSYRKEFLSRFQLEHDSVPEISKHGDGSSFTGQSKIPTYEELINRYKKISWPERVINLVFESEAVEYLSADEHEFLLGKKNSLK